jgi:hypothetical protein
VVFDDDDLKRLKVRDSYLEGGARLVQRRADTLQALIARLERSEAERDVLAHSVGTLTRNLSEMAKRLEAAEKFIEMVWGHAPVPIEAGRAWNIWRKVSGK